MVDAAHPQCPHCESTDLSLTGKSPHFSSFNLLPVGRPISFTANYECKSCGQLFTADIPNKPNPPSPISWL